MDYFYVSSKGGRQGVAAVSTKELKKRLQEVGKSSGGARNVFVKRYEAYLKESEDDKKEAEAPAEGGSSASHAPTIP
jgi:hypothetical protein